MVGIAVKVALTLWFLVLQKPSRSSKEKHLVKCLVRHLQLCRENNLLEIVLEGRAIQQHLCIVCKQQDDDTFSEGRFAHSFAKFMLLVTPTLL